MGDRKRPQDDGIERAEDGRRGADADRERGHRHQRDPGRRDHLPEREDDVLPDF